MAGFHQAGSESNSKKLLSVISQDFNKNLQEKTALQIQSETMVKRKKIKSYSNCKLND